MKQFEITGSSLKVLHDAILRPNDGVTIAFFQKLRRLDSPLRMNQELNDKEKYVVVLEDADFDFLIDEWNQANTPRTNGFGLWTRAKITEVKDADSNVVGVERNWRAMADAVIGAQEALAGAQRVQPS